MKKIVEESEGEGLEGLLGERVILMCMNYFYTGILIGVNESCVKLKEPQIIYETGEWTEKNWKDSQHLPCDPFYVQSGSIESFGKVK